VRAPSFFELTLRDAPAWRVVQALLWALAGAGIGAWSIAVVDGGLESGLAGWLGGGQAMPWPAVARAASCVALAALSGAIGWRLGRPVELQLRWSGTRWELLGQAGWQPAVLRAMLDLGGWMLLRAQPEIGRTRWVGVSDAAIGPPGHLLRAALYCAPCVDPGRADEDRAHS
jgi:hypothetical protein